MNQRMASESDRAGRDLEGSGFGDPRLRSIMMRLRRVDGRRNLAFLVVDYLAILAIVGGAVGFSEWRAAWGLNWAWNVPVFAVAVVLMGGSLHRLAGLGHESAHYTLIRNKFANDLVGDLFCFFPIWSSVHLYRLFHMAHHKYVNDPELDPDLVNMGRSKRVDEFPMTRGRFVRTYYLRVLTSPLSFYRYQWDYVYVNTFGKGGNVYMRRLADGDGATVNLRLGTWLGLAYVVGLHVGLWRLWAAGRADLTAAVGGAALVVALAVLALLPRRALFRSPFRQPYSERFGSAVRLAWWTAVLVGLALLRSATGGWSDAYAALLWFLPMGSSLMFFMLLRDVYQHANSEDDRITNTRVFRADPFTEWAVFIHGQGLHTPHHLFPAVPHYALEELHEALKRHAPDYAERVVECDGTFANRSGLPTILDVMTAAR